jgi:two-component system KDP operon response regulator KdpE
MSIISKILIIDDSKEVVDSVSLTFHIRWPQTSIISTGKGEEGVDLVAKEHPDLVILDIGLPDINGFEALKRIRLFSSVPVIILTVIGDETEIVKGLELGADEYIVKPFRQMELLSRIKAVTRRQSQVVEETEIVCRYLCLNPSTRIVYLGDKQIHLTRTENIILSKLMQNAGSLLNYDSLAEDIWNTNYPDAIKSLNVYIRRLRNKIEVDPSHPKLIINKQGLGYLLVK